MVKEGCMKDFITAEERIKRPSKNTLKDNFVWSAIAVASVISFLMFFSN